MRHSVSTGQLLTPEGGRASMDGGCQPGGRQLKMCYQPQVLRLSPFDECGNQLGPSHTRQSCCSLSSHSCLHTNSICLEIFTLMMGDG